MKRYEFIGVNAGILTISMGGPMHIILDRLTGKAMDCYVEFMSIADVQNFVDARTRATRAISISCAVERI